jgi:tetratricopeptide (TPR) repeat protein
LSAALAWLSEAREYSGQLDEALAHRRRQLASLAVLEARFKDDTDLRSKEMVAHRAVSRLLASKGDLASASQESAKASVALNSLTRIEPANTEWMQWGAFINFERAGLEVALNRPQQARAIADAGCGTARNLAARDRSVSAWRIGLQLSCLEVQARIALRTGASDRALGLSQQALTLARTDKDPIDRGMSVTKAETMLGNALKAEGQADAARGAYQRALAAWPANTQQRPSELADRAMLLSRLGRRSEAAEARERLSAMGYRYPDYRMEGS